MAPPRDELIDPLTRPACGPEGKAHHDSAGYATRALRSHRFGDPGAGRRHPRRGLPARRRRRGRARPRARPGRAPRRRRRGDLLGRAGAGAGPPAGAGGAGGRRRPLPPRGPPRRGGGGGARRGDRPGPRARLVGPRRRRRRRGHAHARRLRRAGRRQGPRPRRPADPGRPGRRPSCREGLGAGGPDGVGRDHGRGARRGGFDRHPARGGRPAGGRHDRRGRRVPARGPRAGPAGPSGGPRRGRRDRQADGRHPARRRGAAGGAARLRPALRLPGRPDPDHPRHGPGQADRGGARGGRRLRGRRHGPEQPRRGTGRHRRARPLSAHRGRQARPLLAVRRPAALFPREPHGDTRRAGPGRDGGRLRAGARRRLPRPPGRRRHRQAGRRAGRVHPRRREPRRQGLPRAAQDAVLRLPLARGIRDRGRRRGLLGRRGAGPGLARRLGGRGRPLRPGRARGLGRTPLPHARLRPGGPARPIPRLGPDPPHRVRPCVPGPGPRARARGDPRRHCVPARRPAARRGSRGGAGRAESGRLADGADAARRARFHRPRPGAAGGVRSSSSIRARGSPRSRRSGRASRGRSP